MARYEIACYDFNEDTNLCKGTARNIPSINYQRSPERRENNKNLTAIFSEDYLIFTLFETFDLIPDISPPYALASLLTIGT